MNNRCSCLGTFLEHETSEKMKQNLFAHTTPSPPINTTARRTNDKQIKNSVSLRWPKPSHDVKTPKDADVHLGEGGHRKKARDRTKNRYHDGNGRGDEGGQTAARRCDEQPQPPFLRSCRHPLKCFQLRKAMLVPLCGDACNEHFGIQASIAHL